jgi:hypothetical protein
VKFEIVELKELSGKKAKIYSIVILDGSNSDSLFDQFLDEYYTDYEEEMEDIYDHLKTYGHYTGLRGNRIIEHEGESLGDGIVAICNRPNKLFRLYAIMYNDFIAIVGGGGMKPGGGALRNYDKPRKENDLIKKIKKTLDAAESCDDLTINNNGIKSKTGFIYNTEDYE